MIDKASIRRHYFLFIFVHKIGKTSLTTLEMKILYM